MTRIFKKLKEQNGEISILFVIISLVLVLYITSELKLFEEQNALDEVQSILDMTGVSTLERVIDIRLLKDELFGIDTNNQMGISDANKVLSGYEDQIKKEYKKSLKFNEKIIESYNIDVQDVYFENSTWGKKGKSPQIILETIVTIKLKVGIGLTDQQTRQLDSFFSSKRGSSIEVVNYGTTEDGIVELTLRSTVRSVYS